MNLHTLIISIVAVGSKYVNLFTGVFLYVLTILLVFFSFELWHIWIYISNVLD